MGSLGDLLRAQIGTPTGGYAGPLPPDRRNGARQLRRPARRSSGISRGGGRVYLVLVPGNSHGPA
jgi:hypothetical protein